MTAVSSMPYLDLTQSQYLWPSPAVDLRTLVANASARAEYKAQLQAQREASGALQKQFVKFIAQLVHQEQRAAQMHLQDHSLVYSAGFSPSPVSAPLPPTFTAEREPVSPSPVCRRPPDASANTHRHRISLVPPRPRLSSTLSPTPRHIPLPGPLRRPIPPRRARAAPESLFKQALINATQASRGACADRMEFDESLGQSWVLVPREDWEMVHP